MAEDIKNFIKFQTHRKIVGLYKDFLNILEDLEAQGYKFSDETYNHTRKRVLDAGNDTIREINGYLERVEMTLK